jgi:hypothetical protein
VAMGVNPVGSSNLVCGSVIMNSVGAPLVDTLKEIRVRLLVNLIIAEVGRLHPPPREDEKEDDDDWVAAPLGCASIYTSTMSFFVLCTNATTSSRSARGTWKVSRVA